MTVEMVGALLGWCSIINMGMLLCWFLMFALAGDWIYRLHGKWFKMPKDTFCAIHYAGMTFFKIAIFFFNVIPYFALRIVG
ncbi:MAG: DUF6868 family protein [Candidatus Omnitrophota bacterium]